MSKSNLCLRQLEATWMNPNTEKSGNGQATMMLPAKEKQLKDYPCGNIPIGPGWPERIEQKEQKRN
jgi:hypothetical protein